MSTNQLKTGQKAPVFTANDVFGKKVSLSTYKESYVLLSFMRYSGCPWCNLAIHRLAVEYKLLKKQNCEILVVVQSSPENIIQNIYDRHAVKPAFPIISDPQSKLYETYCVRPSVKASAQSLLKIPQWVHAVKHEGFKQSTVDGNYFMVPAWFLISPNTQRIVKAHYGSSYYEHQTFTEIYEILFGGEE